MVPVLPGVVIFAVVAAAAVAAVAVVVVVAAAAAAAAAVVVAAAAAAAAVAATGAAAAAAATEAATAEAGTPVSVPSTRPLWFLMASAISFASMSSSSPSSYEMEYDPSSVLSALTLPLCQPLRPKNLATWW